MNDRRRPVFNRPSSRDLDDIPRRPRPDAVTGSSALRRSEIRARLRQLTGVIKRARERAQVEEKMLRTLVRELDAAMSLLSVYSGPEGGELFRHSLPSVKFEMVREGSAQFACLQLLARTEVDVQSARFASFLTSPRSSELERKIAQTAESLCLYANTLLRIKRAEATCRSLRDLLRLVEKMQPGSASARSHTSFYSSYSFRARRMAREGTQNGTQYPEVQVHPEGTT